MKRRLSAIIRKVIPRPIESKNIVKALTLNQLLLHPKSPCLSFYLPSFEKDGSDPGWDAFFHDMAEQLILQERRELVKVLAKAQSSIRKIMKTHPDRAHGFFFSEKIQGYITLNSALEPFCTFGTRFHVRPILEEVLVNPEFIIVNVSLYDISVYRADFKHVEIIKHYEFDDFSLKDFEGASRFLAPQYMGLIPYKSILAIRAIAKKIMDMTLYDSLPVVVTGLTEMKAIFMKHFEDETGVLSHFDEDFYEKTCVEILARCKVMRPAIMDFYSAQLKARLSRLLKSRKILTDIDQVVKSVSEGNVVHLVLPVEQKLWGKIDLEKGTVELHKKMQKRDPSVDIFNELAEEVMRQGGKIQFLGSHFFPGESRILAVLKGA